MVYIPFIPQPLGIYAAIVYAFHPTCQVKILEVNLKVNINAPLHQRFTVIQYVYQTSWSFAECFFKYPVEYSGIIVLLKLFPC
jgi:hypothetical protein